MPDNPGLPHSRFQSVDYGTVIGLSVSRPGASLENEHRVISCPCGEDVGATARSPRHASGNQAPEGAVNCFRNASDCFLSSLPVFLVSIWSNIFSMCFTISALDIMPS